MYRSWCWLLSVGQCLYSSNCLFATATSFLSPSPCPCTHMAGTCTTQAQSYFQSTRYFTFVSAFQSIHRFNGGSTGAKQLRRRFNVTRTLTKKLSRQIITLPRFKLQSPTAQNTVQNLSISCWQHLWMISFDIPCKCLLALQHSRILVGFAASWQSVQILLCTCSTNILQVMFLCNSHLQRKSFPVSAKVKAVKRGKVCSCGPQ